MILEKNKKKQGVTPWSQAYDKGRINLIEVLPLDLPLCICIEPTNICNFKCQMCWQSTEAFRKQGGPFEMLHEDVFEKFLVDIKDFCRKANKKLKLVKLYFTGEPLLNKNIVSMVRCLKDADICDQIEITSNASLLTSEVARGLVDAELDYFRASIYAVSENLHRHVTQTRVMPAEIYKNIAYFYRYRNSQGKERPFIAAKMMELGEEENTKFRELYRDISDEQIVECPWEQTKTKGALEKLYGSKKAGDMAQQRFLHNAVWKRKKACRYPFTHMTVRYNGDIVVCCADWSRDTKVGNIMENTLEEVWNGKRLYDFRVMQLKNHGVNHPLCATCELPLHNRPEDNIDDLSVGCLSWH